jgi:tyrosine-protein phosphatase
MPPTTARRMYEDQLPSFMTVFGLDAEATAGMSTHVLEGDKNTTTAKPIAAGDVKGHANGQRTVPAPPSDSSINNSTRQSRLVGPRHLQFSSTQNPLPQVRLEPRSQFPLRVGPRHGASETGLLDGNQGTMGPPTKSTGSSPTTTISSIDSSPVSGPSPASPASPSDMPVLIPLNNYHSTSFGDLSPAMNMLSVNNGSNYHLERPMTSPAAPRRPRNMKGLSIQPPFNGSNNAAAFASDLASPAFLNPAAPVAVVRGESTGTRATAAAPIKRKPSLLSLKTNACDLVARSHQEVPPSPGMPPILQRRALKHSTSTPHMLSGLKSCTFGPVGGMTFPKVLERNESGLSEVLRPLKSSMNPSFNSPIQEEESTIRLQLASRAQLDQVPYAEQENNEDQRSPGYPDGPIAIYGDNVFLYMEPTAEEASSFDLVINVAREVRNPFHPGRDDFEGQEDEALLPKITEGGSGSSTPGAVPDTAATQATFMTALEHQKTPTPEPEYVHMPWDHHTNISADLMTLCDKIDSRIREGKKVLIHCQQGASRSASLIIAYGMYLNPELSVNDAYYAAQARSRWISPNMKLMYCLQDFQKEVVKRRTPQATGGFRQRANRSPSKHKLTLSAEAIPTSPQEPRTAPLPSNPISPGASSQVSESPSPVTATAGESPTRGRKLTITSSVGRAITPGPSSAPSSFSWPGSETTRVPTEFYPETLSRRPTVESSLSSTDRSLPKFAKPSVSSGSSPSPALKAKENLTGEGGGGTITFAQFMSPLSYGQPISSALASTQAEHDASTSKDIGTLPNEQALMSPRAERMIRKPFCNRVESAADLTPKPVPSTSFHPSFPSAEGQPSNHIQNESGGEPSLPFSPRTSVVSREPFYPFARPLQPEDPRSPVILGEAHIVRSIDEQLI